MAQRRANNSAMNGYNGRRRAYFLAYKPVPDAEPDAPNDASVNGKPLGALGKANGAKAKKPAKAILTESERDKLVERFKEEYQAGWNKDRDNQEEAYRDLRLIGDDKTEHWDADALKERTDQGRPTRIVNQSPQFIRQVTGDILEMKLAIKAVPIEGPA